jgi:hypothetical protein
MQLPPILKPASLLEWQNFVDKPDFSKIKDQLQIIDDLMIDTLFGGKNGDKGRVQRFNRDYLP